VTAVVVVDSANGDDEAKAATDPYQHGEGEQAESDNEGVGYA
jgi:hypothetical protein